MQSITTYNNANLLINEMKLLVLLIKAFTLSKEIYISVVKIPFSILRTVFKVAVIGVFILPLILACPILAYYLAKLDKAIKFLLEQKSKMATSDLEQLILNLEEIENKNKMSIIDISTSLSNSPIFLKPFAYAIKESIDQVINFKIEIREQINSDKAMFSEALSNDIEVGFGYEMTPELD